MGLNSTQSEQIRRAAEELAIKVRLERQFSAELNRAFRRIGADLGESISNTGGTVGAGQYANDSRIILNKNYVRVQRKFTGEIVRFLVSNRRNIGEKIIRELTAIAEARGTSLASIIKRMKAVIVEELNSFREFNVAITNQQMTETTQREIDRAVTKSEQKLRVELGREPTNGELGKAARIAFTARQKSRAAMIAATETQKAAEGTKQIERDNFRLIRNNSVATQLELEPVEPEEVWVTQGDSLVRDGDASRFNHLSADGQVKVGETFTVSNELLRFPGDITFGASIGNVARCRCSAITVIR